MDNKVKPRYDGKGSLFGNLHRNNLPSSMCMFDVDRMMVTCKEEIWLKRENECFVEYLHKHGDIIFNAIFEVKYKFNKDALNGDNSCNMARQKMAQLLKCRLFVVFQHEGKQPLEFYEIDTSTGANSHIYTLEYDIHNSKEAVRMCWQEIGLLDNGD